MADNPIRNDEMEAAGHPAGDHAIEALAPELLFVMDKTSELCPLLSIRNTGDTLLVGMTIGSGDMIYAARREIKLSFLLKELAITLEDCRRALEA